MSNMGARFARMFRNFNLENRALREISKEKPRPAPRHAVKEAPSAAASDGVESIHRRNDPLLSLLRSVYVESTDPPPAAEAAEASTETAHAKDSDRRPLRFSFPGKHYGLVELTDVPKGKLTIAEALKVLSSHQNQPLTWTPEKIAQEYTLDLTDTKALVEFFIPFQVKIIAPQSDGTKQIKPS